MASWRCACDFLAGAPFHEVDCPGYEPRDHRPTVTRVPCACDPVTYGLWWHGPECPLFDQTDPVPLHVYTRQKLSIERTARVMNGKPPVVVAKAEPVAPLKPLGRGKRPTLVSMALPTVKP